MTRRTHSKPRRRFLQTAGAATALAVAGCLGSGSDGDSADRSTGDDTDSTDEASATAATSVDVDRIARDPTDIPDPVDWTEPREHDITIETERLTAEIEPGVTFDYMTFEGQVPGPMIRVRQGDRVNLTFDVPEDLNVEAHNMDFHAVYGPGGGADATTIAPGDDPAQISFTAEYAGVFIYHCAIPNMDQHISSGMFGSILVEPEDGLPEVDREFYLGQHEIYTDGDLGEEGHHGFDFDAMLAEQPTYVVFNGQAYGFTEDGVGPMHAEVGETARVYFANGGPNLLSSWHPIGNVWSRFYRDGDLLTEPDRNIETAPVAPGTTAAAEMEFPVPGPVKIVDHALTRAGRRGALAVIDVEGEEQPEIYDPNP
ncbi:copper-containing nitrite reductase [Halopiger aswanensis]|uniref:Copper-containing nitrite reductase n=1 Tax=Halopiger aswanensis TaxID=148449 RepID=A0A3R7EHJ8_9EURY|nr:copper-containing nitrite reductase [Halopiger aswanensis]RKD97893.1 dissimilatory nitrite reductase (NO-forming) copper type apoprotein [Halopiger aswanensis]